MKLGKIKTNEQFIKYNKTGELRYCSGTRRGRIPVPVKLWSRQSARDFIKMYYIEDACPIKGIITYEW